MDNKNICELYTFKNSLWLFWLLCLQLMKLIPEFYKDDFMIIADASLMAKSLEQGIYCPAKSISLSSFIKNFAFRE
jgi:hypothetical protein